jgi:hypothetical protein
MTDAINDLLNKKIAANKLLKDITKEYDIR